MEKIHILFHDDSDGYASAAVAFKAFENLRTVGVDIFYHVVQYNRPFPDIEIDKLSSIYILDFSYSKAILDDIANRCHYLQVIDHHETAQEALKDTPYSIFDMTKSGAMLTWEYFYPGQDAPSVIKLVQDRDLWRFDLLNSKAFEAGIIASGKSKNLAFWADLINDESYTLAGNIITEGSILVKALEGRCNSFISRPDKYKIVNLFDMNVVIYNTTADISELAEAFYSSLELDIDYTMSYFITNKGEVILSLRSHKSSGINVGSIAKIYGGGGHANAAGVPLSLKDGLAFLEAIYSL